MREVDSSGLTELVESHTTATRRGGRITLARVTPHVGELLRITRLAGAFHIFQLEAEAIESFKPL